MVLGSQKPGLYELRSFIESNGRYFKGQDRTTGDLLYGDCWAGKAVSSETIKVRLKDTTDPDDMAVIELLGGKDIQNSKGLSHIWSRHVDRYKLAIKQYPHSRFAKYCELWAARTTPEWEWEKVVQHYKNVLTKYPVFHFTDDAKIELSKVYIKNHWRSQGLKAKARDLLQSILKDHPRSDSVCEARKLLIELESMGSNTKGGNSPRYRKTRAESPRHHVGVQGKVPKLKQMYLNAVIGIGIAEENVHWIRSYELEQHGGAVHCGSNANRKALSKPL